jgi:hypothetical protein
MADSTESYSFISDSDLHSTIYTPTETDRLTDDFEILSISPDEPNPRWDLASTCSTSVLTSAYEHEYAYGRRYHGYKSGRYPMPNDTQEQQREDTIHAMMMELTNGRLFMADVGDHPQKIIDLGTGTGTWVVDVADKFPSASVIGTDLSPIQPTWLPMNVRMYVEDCEEPDWLHGSYFDLIHFRGIANALRDLPGVLAKVLPHVRHDGWVEFQEIMPSIRCDDDSMADDDPLHQLTELFIHGMRQFGFQTMSPADLEQALIAAGFRDVQCIVRKVPISTWPHDKQLRTVGLLMKESLLDSLDALAAKPLVALNISLEARRALVARATESLNNNGAHRYVECCFCFGRKDEMQPRE